MTERFRSYVERISDLGVFSINFTGMINGYQGSIETHQTLGIIK